MESNFESQSPENADREPSFRKSSNDKGNRKYRRHSSVSGSASPSSDGSRKHERSASPAFPRDDPMRTSDVHQRRKSGGRDSDMESGRSRYDKGGDSHRHSDRWSHKSSRDHHKHGDSSRYHKRVDEGERNYHRSSGYSRESRDGTRSDRVRQGSEYDKSGDYRQNMAKYTKEKYDSQEYKGKDREESKKHSDKDSNMVRATSSRRHVSSYVDDYNRGGRDKHNKDGGGQDDMKNYGKSLGDHRSDNTYSAEEETRYDRHSNAGKEIGGSRLKETQKSNIKDMDRGKDDAIEKRKHRDRESDRHEERFSKAADGRDYNTSSTRRSCVENERYQDNPTRINEDKESSPKKFKFVEADKGKNNEKDGQILSKFHVAEDERLHSRSNLPHETTTRMMPEPAQASNKAEISHDLDAAKVAALKAAELVNRNLTGGGYMSTDQKKKLLWGSKKSTAVEESGHRWDVPLFSDRERQEKFKKLMGVKGDLKPEHKADNKHDGGLLQAEKQEQLQMDLEKQYTAGLRRRDGRTVGLGL